MWLGLCLTGGWRYGLTGWWKEERKGGGATIVTPVERLPGRSGENEERNKKRDRTKKQKAFHFAINSVYALCVSPFRVSRQPRPDDATPHTRVIVSFSPCHHVRACQGTHILGSLAPLLSLSELAHWGGCTPESTFLIPQVKRFSCHVHVLQLTPTAAAIFLRGHHSLFVVTQ